MNVVGLFAFDDNPAACLLVDGQLVAFVEEERFSRVKGSPGHFPSRALAYCLGAGQLTMADVDRIAFGWDCSKYPWAMTRHIGASYWRSRRHSSAKRSPGRDWLGAYTVASTLARYHPAVMTSRIKECLRSAGVHGPLPPIDFVPHHLAHAYSAYFCSPFSRAGILTLDGSGEETCTQLAVGDGDTIRVVDSIPLPHSLGWFYAAVTEYLGFSPHRDEGKVMGLAALGQAGSSSNKWVAPLSRMLEIRSDGYEVDPRYTKFGSHSYGSRFTDELVDLLTATDAGASPVSSGETVTDVAGTRPRYLGSPYVDIAWAAQHLLERAAVALAQTLLRDHHLSNLCLAGGVSLNCKMNGEILRRSGCRDIFVQPASNDAGTALGAAMYVAAASGETARTSLTHCHYGPGFSNDAIRAQLHDLGLDFRAMDDPCEATASLLAEGKIVAWFQGRMEFGSRALGGRSILASPLFDSMKDALNNRVKFREPWRPFGPSVLEEGKARYLERPGHSSFMTVAFHQNPEAGDAMASVAHVDGTVRPQTVTPVQNPRYHELLTRVGALTGHPMVINTSFNVKDEPIVCTPQEAVRCFYGTGLDALVIGDFLLQKPRSTRD